MPQLIHVVDFTNRNTQHDHTPKQAIRDSFTSRFSTLNITHRATTNIKAQITLATNQANLPASFMSKTSCGKSLETRKTFLRNPVAKPFTGLCSLIARRQELRLKSRPVAVN